MNAASDQCAQSAWWPLAESLPLDAFVAGRTLGEWMAGFAHLDVEVAAEVWVSADDVDRLRTAGAGAVLLDSDGSRLATLGSGDGREVLTLGSSFLLRYPWQLLAVNAQMLAAATPVDRLGSCSSAAHIDGLVALGEGSRILPGVVIEGPVVIGRNCKIGPNCYLRGATAIADGVHIGQGCEVKNSIISEGSAVPHLSYIGDSIVGKNVNLGGGTITSNFRHDGRTHRTLVNGKLVDTGLDKLGTIIGDGVRTGIHTSIYPGRKLGPAVTTLPGAVVKADLY
jgi:UDP-3-O-[3-hydroxymyristoyl] glucosamine N-acyltransferase